MYIATQRGITLSRVNVTKGAAKTIPGARVGDLLFYVLRGGWKVAHCTWIVQSNTYGTDVAYHTHNMWNQHWNSPAFVNMYHHAYLIRITS